MPRRHRRYLVGEPPRARIPGHRPVSVGLLRLDAPAGCHSSRPGGRRRAAARPSRGRLCRRARVFGRKRVDPRVRAASSQRVIGLILANCRLGGGVTFGKAFAPLLRLAYSADRLFWVFKKLMPTAYSQMMGIPKGFQPSPQEGRRSPRRGSCCSRSSPAAMVPSSTGSCRTWLRTGSPWSGWRSRRWSSVPGTIPWRPIGSPPRRQPRIPGAKLVTVQGGGHFFMGHDAEVRTEIGAFGSRVT
jgi:hypothetical protein